MSKINSYYVSHSGVHWLCYWSHTAHTSVCWQHHVIVNQQSASTLPTVLDCHCTCSTIASVVLVFCSFHFLCVLILTWHHQVFLVNSVASPSHPATSHFLFSTFFRLMSLGGSPRWPWNESNTQQSIVEVNHTAISSWSYSAITAKWLCWGFVLDGRLDT